MTVSYQYEVASSTSGGFTRLLFMWRGSLYKLIYRELLLFVVAFGLLSALYRHAFNQDQKRIFEKMVVYCDTFINLIPLSFVLGFYVVYVAGRWWQQYEAIPWPDKIMHSVALYVSGNDEQGRMIRRTLMRYLNLTLILVLRSISSAVKRRLPTLEHVVESGFMTVIELEMFKSVPSVEFNTYWIPCTWFISLLKETKTSSRMTDSQGLKIIMEEFNEFRSKCGLLWSYDWVSIPLVYTQVVTIATYSFFLAALVGRQYVDAAKNPLQMEIDIYIPVFTILQFFFFMGLLKVAEQLINPFGDDDEDFELNWLIDRHTKVSYLGVDTLMRIAPPLVKDLYFDKLDITLPYTEAAVGYKKKTYRGSVHNMQVPEEKYTMFLPEIAEEDEEIPPTPKNSFTNLYGIGNTGSAGTAAAAGTWRSHPSAQSLYKGSEIDFELEADSSSHQHLEMFLGSSKSYPGDQAKKEAEAVSIKTPIEPTRPLSRCECEPVRNSMFSSSMRRAAVWPKSPTLGLIHPSECPIELCGFNDSITALNGADNGSNTDNLWKESNSSLHNLSKISKSPSSEVSLDVHTVSDYHSPSPKYGSKEKIFHGKKFNILKVKSYPKLVPIRLSSGNKPKKGVRWKPMTEETSEISQLEQLRRRTVDSPRTSISCEPQHVNNEIQTASSFPENYCKCCNRKVEFTLGHPEEFQESPRISPDNQMVASESISNALDFPDKHKRTSLQPVTNDNNKNQQSSSQIKGLSNEEKRVAISLPNITSYELDTKRWQSKSVWQHRFSIDFLRKLRRLKNQEDSFGPGCTKTSNKTMNYSKTSHSLPNIRLSTYQETTDQLTHNSQTLGPVPDGLSKILHMRDTLPSNISGSDSSLFSSSSEFPVQECISTGTQKLSTVTEDVELPEEIYSPLQNTSASSHPNLYATNSSSKVFSASSCDSSWQSADWTTLLHADINREDPVDPRYIHTCPSRETSEVHVDNVDSSSLQEVIVGADMNTRPGEKRRNQNGS